MPREHIEFVHRSELQWEDSDVEGIPEGPRQKVLSEDPESGASTLLLEVTDERRDPTADPLTWDHGVELFVLDGEFWLDGKRLGEYDYAYIPPETPVTRFGASTDATVLFMPDGELSTTDGGGDGQAQVTVTAEMEWEMVEVPGFPQGAMMKSLYMDEERGDSTWLLGVLPQWHETRIEVHPVVEEAYQVQGSMETDRGTFTQGSYFWRPADIPHGPFYSEHGCLIFFRTRDGALDVEYIADTADYE
jgi:hypothetical protein